MKKARTEKPINTIPKGAYECGITNRQLQEDKENLNDKTTDEQGNGYPVDSEKKTK